MGMTQYTTKAHIVRAALEGICYQTREVNLKEQLHFCIKIKAHRLLMQCTKIVAFDYRN